MQKFKKKGGDSKLWLERDDRHNINCQTASRKIHFRQKTAILPFIAFVDLEKAFDQSVPRNNLWWALF